MALDNAQFIAELSITDPPGSDPLSQGDDQIRTIKRATQQSFPNIDAAVTLTTAQMNLAAIKNEANVFTATQTIQDNPLVLDAVADVGTSIEMRRSGLLRWTMSFSPDATNAEWVLARFDDLGAFIDRPMEADRATGIVNFAHVPTIAGAPIWTAGEIKMLVTGASAPGTNWFSANGTNGTVDLKNRFFAMSDSFTGNRAPFIDLVAATDVTGSTALTEAQMPSHRHRLRDLQSGGGISDGTAISGANSVGTIRNVVANIFTDASLSGNVVENTGSGSGHTHAVPAIDVDLVNNTDAFQIMPYSYHFQVFQYVP